MSRLRVEVTEPGCEGMPRTTVVYLAPVLNPEDDEKLRPLVRRAVESAQQLTGLHSADCVTLLIAELAQRKADAEAYDREAARRGLLAL